jgi:Glycosyl hydrolase 109, C-terminal domain/Oxidoreductase family, NAD-binding Rossmann fold
MNERKNRTVSRRNFLGAVATAAGAGLSASPQAAAQSAPATSMAGVPFERRARVRAGIVGVGLRGTEHLTELLAMPELVDVVAVCDVIPSKVEAAQAAVLKASGKAPAGYSKGDHDFENLCRRGNLDIVYIATPWELHTPIALWAMQQGKHVATEVPAANTLDECWSLVDMSEKTRRHCIMLENCCYGQNELMVLRMVRSGLFGEVKYGEAAYIHDLRAILTEGASEGLWRRFPHTRENGNLYPTHGLGPVANYMQINRGDRFEFMVSMSSFERSLTEYVNKTFPADDPKRRERYVCGDINTSLIRTAQGRTILLQHDVVSPRPYDRINMVSGTKGCFRDYPPRLFLDGGKHDWLNVEAFREEYDHPFWKKQGTAARNLGDHGGMDFIMNWRLMTTMIGGQAPDMDVYDAAAWSAPKPLSKASVAAGSAPQPFPDFTRGQWKRARQHFDL